MLYNVLYIIHIAQNLLNGISEKSPKPLTLWKIVLYYFEMLEILPVHDPMPRYLRETPACVHS